jgi:hypothetical protein
MYSSEREYEAIALSIFITREFETKDKSPSLKFEQKHCYNSKRIPNFYVIVHNAVMPSDMCCKQAIKTKHIRVWRSRINLYL